MSFVSLVHEHTAPVVKHDGGVVQVTLGSAGKDAGISAHLVPDELLHDGAALDQFVILSLRDALRMLPLEWKSRP